MPTSKKENNTWTVRNNEKANFSNYATRNVFQKNPSIQLSAKKMFSRFENCRRQGSNAIWNCDREFDATLQDNGLNVQRDYHWHFFPARSGETQISVSVAGTRSAHTRRECFLCSESLIPTFLLIYRGNTLWNWVLELLESHIRALWTRKDRQHR